MEGFNLSVYSLKYAESFLPESEVFLEGIRRKKCLSLLQFI